MPLNIKLPEITIALLFCFSSLAFAGDMFPGQPRVSAAYNKVTSAIAELDRAGREGAGGHVGNAITSLDEAKVQLEQATKNKGSGPAAAIKLIDEVNKELSESPVTKEKIEKANKLAKEALKKIVQAGSVQKF